MYDSMIQQVFKSLEDPNLTKEHRMRYESRLKYLLDEHSAIREAELREERAFEQGFKQGLELSKQKHDIEIVIKLIESGMDDILIQKITKLPIEIIEQIRADVSR